jgi:hypothetical protein
MGLDGLRWADPPACPASMVMYDRASDAWHGGADSEQAARKSTQRQVEGIPMGTQITDQTRTENIGSRGGGSSPPGGWPTPAPRESELGLPLQND